MKLNGPIEAATAPLLSREYIEETFMVHHGSEHDGFAHGIGAINVAIHVRNFYEAKIASGELMVVITTKIEEVHTSDGIFFECVACGLNYPAKDSLMPGEFCRCGSKIIECDTSDLEAKIASGEPRIVKTAKYIQDGGIWRCSSCSSVTLDEHMDLKPGEFCRCGAKIVE